MTDCRWCKGTGWIIGLAMEKWECGECAEATPDTALRYDITFRCQLNMGNAGVCDSEYEALGFRWDGLWLVGEDVTDDDVHSVRRVIMRDAQVIWYSDFGTGTIPAAECAQSESDESQ